MAKLYWSAPIDEIGLRQRCEHLAAQFAGRLPNHNELKDLSVSESIGSATIALHQALLAHPQHGPWIASVLNTNPDQSSLADVKIGVVPGFLYSEYPEVGSGGEVFVEIGKRLGIKSEQVPTLSRGLIKENAKILKEWIENQTEPTLWLISLSRGSLETRYILEEMLDQKQVARIRYWVNVNGFVRGCHLSDSQSRGWLRTVRTRLACWWLKVPFQFVWEISTKNPFCSGSTKIPKSIQVFDLVSLPLPQHIPTSLLRRYKALAVHGPNDSLAVFHNSIVDGSLILPLWGQDHFCRGEQMSSTISKLLTKLKQGVFTT